MKVCKTNAKHNLPWRSTKYWNWHLQVIIMQLKWSQGKDWYFWNGTKLEILDYLTGTREKTTGTVSPQGHGGLEEKFLYHYLSCVDNTWIWENILVGHGEERERSSLWCLISREGLNSKLHLSGGDLGRQSRKITLSREMAFLAEQRTYLNISVHLLVSKLTVI